MADKSKPAPLPERPLAAAYEPQRFESELYEFWERNGYFRASDKSAPDQEPFCIVIPPPNVTGVLHMGHALTNTIQDILTRWRRMEGDNALWLPGTDHAGISTQVVVEKQIAKEGKGPTGRPLSRHDLGREEFLKRTWKWKEEHGSTINRQLRRLGSSLDWERERFTMDEGFSRAVLEVFVRLHEQGLIYRGERIINWCPRCHTALSDLEVIPTDRKGHLWHIRYDVPGTNASLTIATTRPETLLGDAAVAVHPDDERYAKFIGKKVELPLLKRLIPIVADPHVDREFGTGALKVTPAHDFNDYEIGARHGLPIIQVMGRDGRITAEGGPYAGLKFAEAREKVVEDLKAQGLLLKTEDHSHKVGLCQRCDHAAEPLVSKQWFVKIAPLAKPAIEAVETGKIQFSPKSWEKTYFEWMHNIRDWCISRQLWWGHQIPAWYCGKCEGITVAREEPKKCSQCGAGVKDLKRDEDVLDTWFSSALWPFGTLGWPEKTEALKTFYPTSILETGFDILFFWVARMIMMGIHFMGEVPFRKVYLHAMVRDQTGSKMSKSKGNVIDPLEVIEEHGADPLRFTFAVMAGQGRDIKLSVDRVEGYRAFCNKLWNAVKFLNLQVEAGKEAGIQPPPAGLDAWVFENSPKLAAENAWILSRFEKLARTVEQGLQGFELNVAAQAIYDFTWAELCDWYLELAKIALKESEDGRRQTLYTLYFVIERLLRLSHPFMPFVTEELWQALPWRKLMKGPKALTIMTQPYPKANPALENPEAEKSVAGIQAIVEALRTFRGENGISAQTRFAVGYVTRHTSADLFVKMNAEEIMALARLSALNRLEGDAKDAGAVVLVANPPVEFRIDLGGLVDVAEEAKRVDKEIQRAREDLGHVRGKLSKESFVAKAPPELVAKERGRESEILRRISELEAARDRLGRSKG